MSNHTRDWRVVVSWKDNIDGLTEVKARAMFEMNARNYPRSANVHDALGDYYLNKKDTTHAIDQFNQALALADTPATRDKLKKLKQLK